MRARIIVPTGLALFAMFFGAGNIIFPLTLGADAGSHILYAIAAFLVAGVGIPFLGLFATSLYQGDYWQFFNKLGKTPSFLLIAFLVLIIGPLFAIPRTAVVTYHTLQPFLPNMLNSSYVLSGIYCVILFLLTYRPSKVMDIIGRFLSPIKLSLFILLIIAGVISAQPITTNLNPVSESINRGLLDGYSTMDLLGAFFFCTVVYQNVLMKAKKIGITDVTTVTKLFLQSCLIGALILALVYIGFAYIALGHAAALQGVATAQMISAISRIVLGSFGSLFVCVCVSFACIATATALTEVTTHFFYIRVFKRKINRLFCLLGTLVGTFVMSILGFSGIMKIALPVLEILYPLLIVYCIIIVALKAYEMKKKSSHEINVAQGEKVPL